MSAELLSQPPQNIRTERELRIIALHSKEKNHIIMPHRRELPRDFLMPGETDDKGAYRIAQQALDLPGMKVVTHIHHESGASAHALEAASGIKTDLRRTLGARVIDLCDFFKDSAVDIYDEIDLALIRQFAETRGVNDGQKA